MGWADSDLLVVAIITQHSHIAFEFFAVARGFNLTASLDDHTSSLSQILLRYNKVMFRLLGEIEEL